MAKKKPATNPVNQGDVDAFALLVHKWQEKLNLMDWRIVQSTKRCKTNVAEIAKRDLPARLATYRVGEDFGAEPVSALTVERTVVHELLHVFLYELMQFCQDRSAQDTDIESAEHRVVNVLERLLVPDQD